MTLVDRASALAAPLAADLGLDLVEVTWTREHGRRILRITIDHPDGVSHTHCESLSRALDPVLDGDEAFALLDEGYHLEVSSPGAERPLVNEADFVRFKGRRVAVKLSRSVEGRRQWIGRLEGATAEYLLVEAEGRLLELPRDAVSRARLALN
ncbi:MAG: ribosome maturation factor RimP [Candidatus Sericytochromatia bacterium]|nr:ribosome maturation factor RimP [Candidatus Tanganyikabacteria bacterium]